MTHEASSLFHTDIRVTHGGLPVKPKLHSIPAHEGMEVVERIGEGATGVNEVV